MPVSSWGPPTWNFFHVLAEKVKEETFDECKHNLFQFIQRICRNLPCPTCASHATSLLKKVNFSAIKGKQDLKNVLFMMHNAVNRQKSKPVFEHHQLTFYSNKKFIPSYNHFIASFRTRGNMTLLADTLHRQFLVAELKTWISKNIRYFPE